MQKIIMALSFDCEGLEDKTKAKQQQAEKKSAVSLLGIHTITGIIPFKDRLTIQQF